MTRLGPGYSSKMIVCLASGSRRREMRIRLLKSIGASTLVVSVLLFLNPAEMTAQNQAPTAPALKTAWGEPDLQGIWTVEYDTPLQRSPRFAEQEFFTEV